LQIANIEYMTIVAIIFLPLILSGSFVFIRSLGNKIPYRITREYFYSYFYNANGFIIRSLFIGFKNPSGLTNPDKAIVVQIGSAALNY
jgi:hypothetical protein